MNDKKTKNNDLYIYDIDIDSLGNACGEIDTTAAEFIVSYMPE